MDRDLAIRRGKFLARRRSTQELERLLADLMARVPWDDLSDDEVVRLVVWLETEDAVLWKALTADFPSRALVDDSWWKTVPARSVFL